MHKPKRVCLHPGCPAYAVPGSSRCLRHRVIRVDRRPSASQRGYDRQWMAIRRAVLAEEPRCRGCGAKATMVDHIRPLRLGGTHDRWNLQALCRSCHARKTRAEMVSR